MLSFFVRSDETPVIKLRIWAECRKCSNKPPRALSILWIFAWEAFQGRLQNVFLVVGHMPFEIRLPINYFLMLQIHTMGCLFR